MKNNAIFAGLIGIASVTTASTAQTDIFWNGGSSNWGNSVNWSPMNIPDAPNENARLMGPPGASVRLDASYAIGLLEIGPGLTLVFNPSESLTLAGTLLDPTGTVEIKLDADPVPVFGGSIQSAGPINLDGTLRVSFVGGFQPGVFPAVYKIASANPINGNFSSVILPPPPASPLGAATYFDTDSFGAYFALTCWWDSALPFGVADLADITNFINGWLSGAIWADVAEPFGILDLADIVAFVSAFMSGNLTDCR